LASSWHLQYHQQWIPGFIAILAILFVLLKLPKRKTTGDSLWHSRTVWRSFAELPAIECTSVLAHLIRVWAESALATRTTFWKRLQFGVAMTRSHLFGQIRFTLTYTNPESWFFLQTPINNSPLTCKIFIKSVSLAPNQTQLLNDIYAGLWRLLSFEI